MVNNLKEAKKLLEKYKSITLEQLEEAYDEVGLKRGDEILSEITGFGQTSSCILCLAVDEVCENCIYSIRETFMLERARELSVNTYKLIPKNYGDDTIIVKSQKAQVIYEVDELFGDTTYYYVFISNNKAIAVMKGEKYRLQE